MLNTLIILVRLAAEQHSKEIPIFDMTQDARNVITSWQHQMIYFKSTSYPQFTSLAINICEMSIKESTKLQIQIMDLYAKNNDDEPCPYELITNNKITEQVLCANSNFDNVNKAWEYETSNQPETIQIAFQEKHQLGIPQGKLWLLLKSRLK